jgi:hypothetical protein
LLSQPSPFHLKIGGEFSKEAKHLYKVCRGDNHIKKRLVCEGCES